MLGDGTCRSELECTSRTERECEPVACFGNNIRHHKTSNLLMKCSFLVIWNRAHIIMYERMYMCVFACVCACVRINLSWLFRLDFPWPLAVIRSLVIFLFLVIQSLQTISLLTFLNIWDLLLVHVISCCYQLTNSCSWQCAHMFCLHYCKSKICCTLARVILKI
jgi:hypothetical protein